MTGRWVAGAMTAPVETVAIVGAGNMGSGIAQKTAQEHFTVQMVDREQQWVDKGQATITAFLEEAVQRHIFSPAEVEAIQGRITGVVGSGNVDPDTDLVIEAVFEDLGVKSAVFADLDAACGPSTILASNTSSLSVNDLAEASGRPDRFVGLHFFYHPAKNRLIEVIPGEQTSAETLTRVSQYCKMLGKVVIVCKDAPGFVVNRFFVPWLNEAALLLEEGVTSAAAIDAIACEAFSIGMGPFALMNLTGPPIALHSADHLATQLKTPRFTGAGNLRSMVEAGDQWAIGMDVEVDAATAAVVRERLLGVVFAVVAQIVDEGVCSLEDVDRGAKVGLRWELGPFELMNELGVTEAHRMAAGYAGVHESGFAVPDFLGAQAATGLGFDFQLVDVVRDGAVATVRINRPEAMNALNATLVRQLSAALDEVNADDSVSTVVLEGAGKAFVAGADVKFFVDKLRADSFDDIQTFTEEGHALLGRLEHSPKTTIALTTGLALGGGLELALACDYRVGTRRTQFRFPETSIGIYPGMGGTQRTTRIMGAPLARWAVLAGNWLDAQTAADTGLVTHLVAAGDVASTVTTLAAAGKPANKYAGAPVNETEAVRWAAALYADDNLPKLVNGDPSGLDAEDPFVGRQLKQLSRTAPVALRMASSLISEGAAAANLEDGLALELQRLKDIFSTDDALEGLSALIEGRRPIYTGA